MQAFSHQNSNEDSTEEFDAALVIALDSEKSTDEILKVDYYIVLSSVGEIYPTLNADRNQMGIFQSVTPALQARRRNLHSYKDTKNGSGIGLQVDTEHEPVLYVGYYSTHEQSMQAVMDLQAKTTELALKKTLNTAADHCLRDTLWNKMINGGDEMSFEVDEFQRLVSLIKIIPCIKTWEMSDDRRWPVECFINGLTVYYPKHRKLSPGDEFALILNGSDPDLCIALIFTKDTKIEEKSSVIPE